MDGSETYRLNTAQIIEIGPGNKVSVLNMHNTMQHIGSPEPTADFIVALTDFTDHNGATRIIPDSNLWAGYKSTESPEDRAPAEMEAGNVCFISGKVVRGGGANRTDNFYRRGITLSFQCYYLTPEEAYPFLVEKSVAKQLSPCTQRMIAFRSQLPKDSPSLWQCDYKELADAIGLRP
ncbi:hypothetical protein B0O99DRAFT_678330 [Bisporella sp. PMI_857]|nr:hypothetical protein B0O99DRAFT_678330 [Bisporella sp. PMI_857]